MLQDKDMWWQSAKPHCWAFVNDFKTTNDAAFAAGTTVCIKKYALSMLRILSIRILPAAYIIFLQWSNISTQFLAQRTVVCVLNGRESSVLWQENCLVFLFTQPLQYKPGGLSTMGEPIGDYWIDTIKATDWSYPCLAMLTKLNYDTYCGIQILTPAYAHSASSSSV